MPIPPIPPSAPNFTTIGTAPGSAPDVSQLATAAFTDALSLASGLQYVVPTTGQTVVVACIGQTTFLDIEPAGTLAALTVTLPALSQGGIEVVIYTTQVLTALTVNAATGSTIGGAEFTTLTANASAAYRYNNVTATWMRVR